MKKAVFFVSIALCLILLSTTAFAWGEIKRSKGQTVYVPATSNQVGDYFTYTRVIIRNIDPNNSITVNSVSFYAPNGDFFKEFLLAEPVIVGPWESISNFLICGYPIYESDAGRPFFIVEWQADNWVIPSSIVAEQGVLVLVKGKPESRGCTNLQGIVIKEK